MTDELTVLDDRYQLEAVLGRGGMADVYRASDRVLSRPVAVKVLRDTTDDERDRRRFTAEARTLAGLSHPHLVMLLDAGITAERPYLVLELVEGPTLDQECRGRPQDPDRVAEIGAQLAEALAYAHDRGVVHRDVKPGNVLLGDDGRVRLADFGIARLVGDTVRHTQTGQTIGTAAYLSPEQVRGRDVAPATDVYALGLVLLEALTGERAYPGSPTEAALARLSQPPPMPDTLPGHWQDLLAAMTDLEPGARPSASEVARRLRAPADATTPMRGAEPGTDRTAVMSSPLPAAAPPDRGGEVLERARTAYAGVPTHLGAVVAVLAVLVLLVVVVALAAGPDDSGGGTDIPAQTPPQLRDPLRDLHDAVEGGS